MAVVKNLTPNYVTATEKMRKLIDVDFDLDVTMAATDVIEVASFVDRCAEAIAVSGATIVKVAADGTISAISAGDDLTGFWIGYQSAAGDAIGDNITGSLEYWDAM